MKAFGLLLVVAIAAGAWLWLNPEQAADLKSKLPDNDLTKKTATVYKWRNAAGEWQLTDAPPPDGIEYERTQYHEDVNVLPVPPGIATE